MDGRESLRIPALAIVAAAAVVGGTPTAAGEPKYGMALPSPEEITPEFPEFASKPPPMGGATVQCRIKAGERLFDCHSLDAWSLRNDVDKIAVRLTSRIRIPDLMKLRFSGAGYAGDDRSVTLSLWFDGRQPLASGGYRVDGVTYGGEIAPRGSLLSGPPSSLIKPLLPAELPSGRGMVEVLVNCTLDRTGAVTKCDATSFPVCGLAGIEAAGVNIAGLFRFRGGRPGGNLRLQMVFIKTSAGDVGFILRDWGLASLPPPPCLLSLTVLPG